VKQVGGILLKFLVSIALIGLFLQQIDLADVERAARTAQPLYLVAAVLLFTTSNLLGAIQWGYLLRVQDIDLPMRRVISLYFVGVFFNNFLVSNIGGDAVRVYDLSRTTGKGSQSFAATFLDRFVGLFVLILFSLLAFGVNPELWSLSIAVPMACLVGALLGILVFGFSRRMSGWVLGLAGRFAPSKVVSLLEGIREGFMAYRTAYVVLFRVFVIAAGVQMTRIGVYYAVGRGMGLDTKFDHFLIFIPLIAIVAAIPISFGGIGVRENLGAILFGRVGVAPAEALAMMFIGYLTGIVASLFGGISFVMRRHISEAGQDE
jgi:uncharacterized protein (TIRG00374 family)